MHISNLKCHKSRQNIKSDEKSLITSASSNVWMKYMPNMCFFPFGNYGSFITILWGCKISYGNKQQQQQRSYSSSYEWRWKRTELYLNINTLNPKDFISMPIIRNYMSPIVCLVVFPVMCLLRKIHKSTIHRNSAFIHMPPFFYLFICLSFTFKAERLHSAPWHYQKSK